MNNANSRQTGEALFLEHLGWIDRVAQMTASRHGLSPDETSEFESWMRMKFMEDDYAIFRNHRGDSSLRTYLATVVARQFTEYRRQRWGRWRTSGAAMRLGRLAVRLEQLVYRDGYSVPQAIEVLQTSEADVPEEREIIRLLAQLPRREPLRPQQVEFDLGNVRNSDRADTKLRETDAEQQRARLSHALDQALAALPEEDRVIIRLHYFQGLSIGDVARALNLEQKPLYRRVDRILKTIRRELLEEGIDGSMLRAIWPDATDE